VLLCFSRDTTVLEHFNYNSATPPTSCIQSTSMTSLAQSRVVWFTPQMVSYLFTASQCTFERLLQTHLPQLFYHLREIGAQPLRIAFKWIVRAFSGYLSTDQLLLLWDRILGYDSLEIVA
ncbi:hypothetical protein DNTS_011043, partial [Danionella cerebrum]